MLVVHETSQCNMIFREIEEKEKKKELRKN